MRRRRLPALVAALALPLAGCTPFPLGPPPVPPPSDERPVGAAAPGTTFGTQVALGQVPADSISRARRAAYVRQRSADVAAMLDARSAAVLHHDRAAFLASVDPTNRPFYAAQAQLFDNLVALPLAAYALSVTEPGGLPPPAPRDHLGVAAYLPVVQLEYALRGYDSGDVERTYAMTMLRRNGRWVITSTSDVADDSPVQDPWDSGRTAVDVRGTVLLVSNGLTATQRSGALTLVGQAVADDRRYLPSWDGRVVVYLSKDPTLFDRLFDTSTDGHAAGSYAAAEVPQYSGEKGQTGVTGTRVLVNPANLGTLVDTARTSSAAITFRHELTHVALARMVGPARPTWLTEGVAQWVAYAPFPFAARIARARREAAVGGPRPPGVPADARFTTGDDDDLDAAYTDAWLVCQDVVDHEGSAALLRAYAAVSALPASDRSAPGAVDGALERTLHLTVARLQARYLADLRAS